MEVIAFIGAMLIVAVVSYFVGFFAGAKCGMEKTLDKINRKGE